MQQDEKEIRELVSTWMSETKAGNVDGVLSLMTDDAVFLVPGRPAMRKADFASAARAQAGPAAPRFDGSSEVQEIKVVGDWAFAWAELTVAITPPGGAKPIKRSGHTLTVFHKQDGRWLLARDANLLVAVES